MAATRDYEYVVYPEARHSGTGIKIPFSRGRIWNLDDAKRIAKEIGSPAAIYSVSKGRFVGYIHHSGKFVRFGRAY